MPYEIVVKEANRTVATEAAKNLLVQKIQEVFGLETHIEVNQVEKTFDSKQGEVGIKITRVEEFPIVA